MKLLKKEIIGVKPVYDIEVKDNHNFIANGVVVHNCHRVAATTWQKVVTMFPSYRRWGLTATTKRSDNLEGIFFSHIGPVIHKLKGPEIKPRVYRMNLNYKLDLKPFRQWNGDINLAKLVTGLSKIAPRNEIILDATLKAALKGRKIIVFSERREHLENLVRLFNKMAEPHGIKGGLYIGGIKQEILDQTAEECEVLFATYQIAKEALDIPELDTCIFATPVSNEITVEQAVGRITRQYEGKRDPLVIDIVDNGIEICQRMFFKRAKVYNRKNYPIVSGG